MELPVALQGAGLMNQLNEEMMDAFQKVKMEMEEEDKESNIQFVKCENGKFTVQINRC